MAQAWVGIWAPVWGSFLIRYEQPDAMIEATWDYNLRVVQRAEALGYSSVLLLDRSLNSVKGVDRPVLEAWTTAAGLASATKSIELIIANRGGYRHPAIVAQMGANIDQISGGRFAINIVSGWWAHEFEMVGMPFVEHDLRYLQSAEAIEILKSFWTKDRFDFNGRFYRVKDGILGYKPERKPWPTIYFGGESDAAVDLAAREADFYLLNGRPLAAAGELIRRVQARAATHGRGLPCGMSAFVHCRPTEAQAWEEVAEMQAGLGERPERPGVDQQAKHVVTSAASGGIGSNGGIAAELVGSPRQIAERMSEFIDAGVSLFLLQFHPMLEEMERFAAEVLPLLPGVSLGGPPPHPSALQVRG
ncbi:MAG: LLM class flavin-dependent oxidoreductase [Chloroflexi bacterium]|nr:LLM class flavin-dependent oxidoreductase [Chloroflexota bacterium]